jgi:hypothetical protein
MFKLSGQQMGDLLMTYTDLEMNVLNILADKHGNEWQTEDSDNVWPHVDTFELTTDGTRECGTIFGKYNLDPKVYRGVISSLLQKDAIIDDEYEAEKNLRDVPMVAIAITKQAFNEIRKVAA